MTDYKIEIDRVIKKGIAGKDKTEIWAKIKNIKTSESEKKLIWWEDEDGVFHDETPNLPNEIRDKVDNAWIEKRRQW
ncbi:MAG: hypothetical protein R6U21_07120 [Thermoplasmatota archaeon]